MLIISLLFVFLLVLSARTQIQHASSTCPPVWSTISSELTTAFSLNNTCNSDAKAAIRAAFHDCFPTMDCDGSLFLANSELMRSENINIGPTVWMLGTLAERHQVPVSDMIQFAAAHAIATCSFGQRIPIMIGRKDSCIASQANQIPGPNTTGDASLALFVARGFTAEDLAALIGAHTVSSLPLSTSVGGQPPLSQDTTPNTWDNLYYNQTLAADAPFSFQSDLSLSKQSQVGPYFVAFSKNRTAWDISFSNAMQKMSLLGLPESDVLVDCTHALP